MRTVLMLVLGLLTVVRGAEPTLEFQVGQAVNRHRLENQVQPLVLDEVLSHVAQLHAQEMLREGYFGHVSPNEMCKTTRDRLRVCHRYCLSSAENLHRTVGYSPKSAGEDAVKGWMESSGHRKNLLNSRYNRMGIGISSDGHQMLFVQVLSYEPVVVQKLDCVPQEGGYRLRLEAQVADGAHKGAIFFDGKRQKDWDASEDGRFCVELSVPRQGLLQIGQQKGLREWSVETEIPIPLGREDHNHD